MDIRKWLAETEFPVPAEQPAVEPFLIPKQPDARRRRKRSSTDSSLLKIPSPQPRRKGVSAIGRDCRDAQEASGRAHSDVSHSTRSESASDATAARRYARQHRRKTRPDRYEAGTKKGKEQEGGSHAGRESESRKSKRKSRRRKVEKLHNGIEQEFRAKNVSKDRLTLKPLEKMGLFSKGRTSTLVKGRGLPDLVFSEMKFLRNDEHNAQGPDPKKRRKKDHARTKEEDISTFFTSVRPALADVDGNKLVKHGRQTTYNPAVKTDRERERERSAVLDTAVPTIESEGKASYLGFGSRGPRHESTSYFSWSESVRAPGATPSRRKSIFGLRTKRPDSSNYEKREALRSKHASIREQDSPPVVREPGTAMGRNMVCSVAPTQLGRLRSQSLPHRSLSPRRLNLVDRALNRRSTEGLTSPSSMPPVLRAQGTIASQEHAFSGGWRRARSVTASCADDRAVSDENKTPEDIAKTLGSPQSSQGSSGLGRALQHCNYTSQAERQRSTTHQRQNAGMHITPERHDTPLPSRGTSYQRTAKRLSVRFLASDTQSSQRPNFFGHGFYAQQEQQQQLPVQFDAEEGYEIQYPDTVGQSYTGGTGLPIQEDFEYFSDGPVSYGLMEELEDDDIAELGYAAAHVEHVQEPAHTSVVKPGFWRPNKLY